MGCERGQRLTRAGKRREVAVSVEQPLAVGRRKRQNQRSQRVIERVLGQCREVLAWEAWTRHQRLQPRIFELLVAPDARQRGTVARRELFGERCDRMDVEQCSVCIEHECGGWRLHWGTSRCDAGCAEKMRSCWATFSSRQKKRGYTLRVTPWFIWWAILGSNQ